MASNSTFSIYDSLEPPRGFSEEADLNIFGSSIELSRPFSTGTSKQESVNYLLILDLFAALLPKQKSKKQEMEKSVLKGSKQFEEAFNAAVLIDPNIALYKDFLIKTAQKESNFNSHILNKAGAPYYGYFQMGKEEIRRTTGLSVEEFRNDPVSLILGAVKLYLMNLKTIKAIGVYNIGKEKGYSDDALVAGAWMGGPGGVKKYLLEQGDPSDSHWYGGKGGSSVGKRMNEFNS